MVFYLNLNQFDYKLVLDPKYGMEDKVNLVQTKPTYSFGAGLIGRMRLNDNFDLRIEPGLQFVEKENLLLIHNQTTNTRCSILIILLRQNRSQKQIW